MQPNHVKKNPSRRADRTEAKSPESTTFDEMVGFFTARSAAPNKWREVWDSVIPPSASNSVYVRTRGVYKDHDPRGAYVRITLGGVREVVQRFGLPAEDLLASLPDWMGKLPRYRKDPSSIIGLANEEPHIDKRRRAEVSGLLYEIHCTKTRCTNTSLITQILFESRNPPIRSFLCVVLVGEVEELDRAPHMCVVAELEPKRLFLVDSSLQDGPVELNKIKHRQLHELTESRLFFRPNPAALSYAILWR